MDLRREGCAPLSLGGLGVGDSVTPVGTQGVGVEVYYVDYALVPFPRVFWGEGGVEKCIIQIIF